MFEVVISESEYVTYVNPIIVRTVYETMVLPKALYGCELWNTYSKQDINNLEKAHRFCVKHMQQFVKSTSTYFSLSCINLVTLETFIDFKKLQLLGQLCRLPCRHLSKSVFVHRLVSFMNGDKQCVGFIPDIYKLLDTYQLVGYILTFLKDALFPS